jgi:2-oxoglutarate/2-oxoacid ferredoxin oxidoreductase subunit beta
MVATVTEPRRDKVNLVGLEKGDYRGRPSTLCSGCGHDSISSQIITVAFELSLPPYKVIKMSGIGCSSKSPAYFLNRSHGFNALHGRMPSVVTGAGIANRSLTPIAVSGDGDTGSIGIGQYKHLLRRNVPMVYIIENNGVYGLTKGQFSATADVGQVLKHAGTNELPPIDLCLEAIAADCGFVARSFSGDAKQVRELLKAAISFNGTAVIDIISPCVTFNNHEDSTKSYPYGKANEEPLHDITFIPKREEITVDYEEGQDVTIEMHDGQAIRLHKLDRDYDPTDKFSAIKMLLESQAKREFVTGLVYFNEARGNIQEVLNLDETPLVEMPESRLRPSKESLEALMSSMA